MIDCLIIEPSNSGHSYFYVQLLAEELRRQGKSFKIALNIGANQTEEFKLALACFNHESVLEIADFRLGSISSLAEFLGAERVIVPGGDSFAYQIFKGGKWRSKAKLNLLIMREFSQRGNWFYWKIGTLIKAVILGRVRKVPRVNVFLLKPTFWNGHSRFSTIRDPLVTQEGHTRERLANVNLGTYSENYVFGVFGAITDRKNVPLIIRAAQEMRINGFDIVIAGKIEAAVLEEINIKVATFSRAGCRISVTDRLLDDDELRNAIASVDCVVVAHSNEGPSGIMSLALSLGTRVLAAGARTLKSDLVATEKPHLWSRLSMSGIRDNMERAMENPRPKMMQPPSVEDFTGGLIS
jgi:glycosyltransferase involved in cell wall biosynthesis